MARTFTSASSQQLSVNNAMVTGFPYCFGGWVKMASTGIDTSIMAIDSGTTPSRLSVLGGTLLNKFLLYCEMNGAGALIVGSTTFSAGVWYHVMGRFNSGNFELFVNGASDGTTSTSITFAQPTDFRIGARTYNGTLAYFDGSVADTGVWPTASFGVAEAAVLARGYAPSFVRPDLLAAEYRLLNNDGDRDWRGKKHLTAANSPTYGQHQQIIYPSSPRLRGYMAAGGGGAGDPAALDWIGQTTTLKAQAWEVAAY